MEEHDFRAEYSKSGRAGCKSCKMNIAKDVLRLAVMVQSPHFDGKQPNWFHFACFWSRARPTSIEQFGGIDNLRWEDQQKIKDSLKNKTGGGGGSSSSSKKAKAGSSGAESGGVNYKDYKTEYAKTSKSKCRGCEDFIPKAEVRVSKKSFTSQRAMAYGPQDEWYHVDCFIKERDALDFGSDKDISKIDLFPCLKPDDKKMLIDKFGKVTAGSKRKAESGSGDAKPSKSAKVEESEEEKSMKKQNQIFWKCRDSIEKLITKDAMKGLLEYNNQEVPSGEQNILNRLADVMTFGTLKSCPECKDGQLVFSSSGYRCHGNLTEWTKCQYVTSDPKRGTFKVPDEYTDVDYLKKYKCKVQTRIIPKDNIASSSAAAALSDKKVTNKEKPLNEMKFAIIGKVPDKKKLTKSITSLGGEVVSKLDEKVSACFSTKEEVDEDSKKMQEARGLNIRVLSEAFLKDVKDGDFQELLKKHSLSHWGEFTKPKALKSIPQIKSAARDAAMYTKSMPSTQKMTVKGGSAVDPDSGLEKGYHVLKEGKDLYSEVLNMVDVMKGTNSYYKLQVLESDSSGSYYVFRSWGRVGTTIGGTKQEAFYSKVKAKDNFLALYAEKTGNEWEDRAHFRKQPHKFYPIEMDYGEDDAKIRSLSDAGAKSKLAKPIQEVVKMIFDIESMKKAMVEFEIDLKKMPLGKLSKKQVEKAYSVLTEVQGLLSSGGSTTRFLDCSNRFYTLIPHDFGMEKPPLLNNEEILKSKTLMLDSLLEIEVAYSLMKSSDDSEKDPLDVHYEQLKTDMEVMEKTSEEYKRLVQFVHNTHGATHSIKMEVEEVFKINRHGEAKRFKPFKKLHNRMLLWHGSRTTNYAGILSQGLRIAPPEAPMTGYMFGKGVYFADMCSKSANYCRATSANPIAFMLLCEVALGTMYEKQSAEMIVKPPGGCHSTKGLGSTVPDSSDFYTDPEGVVYPMGKGQNTGTGKVLQYNEYIVYDTAQIQMKYLLKLNTKRPY